MVDFPRVTKGNPRNARTYPNEEKEEEEEATFPFPRFSEASLVEKR